MGILNQDANKEKKLYDEEKEGEMKKTFKRTYCRSELKQEQCEISQWNGTRRDERVDGESKHEGERKREIEIERV